ncbi:MAG: hypothetical protein HY243_17805 [Proteobacteria bacterium]|nr:hypothetical protein [Pseudomonadota bacterium]
MKLKILALAAICALALTGCASVAQDVAAVATNLSSNTPSQVATYVDATAAATLATKAVDVAVTSLKFDKGTLSELSALNDGVHAAWLDLKKANDAQQSLSFASFNAALDAFNAYATVKGVAH